MFNVLKRLLPKGMNTEPGTVNAQVFAALAAPLDDAEAAVARLARELFPDGAEDLLADWERVYGLAPSDASDLSGRRQAVVGKMAAQPGISIEAVQIGLKPYLGYLVDIQEYQLQAGDPPEDVFQFTVHVETDKVTVPVHVAALLAAIDRVKPAHTQGHLSFDAFLFDDPDSLCDTALDVLTI